jgi:phosphatidylglycerophosphate synthase
VTGRPWDARLARWLIEPLCGTPVRPNHVTTVRLLTGLAAALLLAHSGYGWSVAGTLLFAASNVIDHADGELARATGRTSRRGHIYDLAVDGLVHVLVFVAIGFGQRPPLGRFAPLLGLAAGLAVGLMFVLLAEASKAKPLTVAGFEVEDVLYLMPVVALADGMAVFLVVAAVGAPLFLIFTAAGKRPHAQV